jgi:hypothetical protein
MMMIMMGKKLGLAAVRRLRDEPLEGLYLILKAPFDILQPRRCGGISDVKEKRAHASNQHIGLAKEIARRVQLGSGRVLFQRGHADMEIAHVFFHFREFAPDCAKVLEHKVVNVAGHRLIMPFRLKWFKRRS